jgi:hypothetical protein
MDEMESFRHSRKKGADEGLRDVSGLATRAGVEPAGFQGVVSQAFSVIGIGFDGELALAGLEGRVAVAGDVVGLVAGDGPRPPSNRPSRLPTSPRLRRPGKPALPSRERERKIRDEEGKIRITALPLSYLACARAGLEPATNVIFRAFAERGLPTRNESELLRRATIAPLRTRRRRDLNPQPSDSMESLSHSAS